MVSWERKSKKEKKKIKKDKQKSWKYNKKIAFWLIGHWSGKLQKKGEKCEGLDGLVKVACKWKKKQIKIKDK